VTEQVPAAPDGTIAPAVEHEPVEGPDAIEGWRRMHPVTPALKGWRILAVVVGVVVIQSENLREAVDLRHGKTWLVVLGAIAVIALLGFVYSSLAWRVTRFAVTDEAVHLRTGLLFRQQRSCGGETLNRRVAEPGSPRQAEHPSHVDQGTQRGLLQMKHGGLLPGLVDDGILEEGQRRQACHAVVRQHTKNVAVHRTGHRALHVVPQRLRAVNRTQVEQGAGQVHLCAHRVLKPPLVARLPFHRARDQE